MIKTDVVKGINMLRYAVYKMENEENIPFNKNDYSLFKYGSVSIAKKYGKLLANSFVESQVFNDLINSGELSTKRILVVPSAYCFTPTASCHLKNSFLFHINLYLADKGLEPVQETKIHRSYSYNHDYGRMNYEERMSAIKGDTFHLDREYYLNKIVLFIDDVRITGAHEHRIIERLKNFKLHNEQSKCTFIHLYLAELLNKNVNPEIEHHLNTFAVNSLDDIYNLIIEKDFEFNIRNVKFILNSEPQIFQQFINKNTYDFCKELLSNAMGNNYHNNPVYIKNYQILKSHLNL